MRHVVVRVFVSFCVLVFYGPFWHGAHRLDISTLFTTLFIWTCLQFILQCIHFIFTFLWSIHLNTFDHNTYHMDRQPKTCTLFKPQWNNSNVKQHSFVWSTYFFIKNQKGNFKERCFWSKSELLCVILIKAKPHSYTWGK